MSGASCPEQHAWFVTLHFITYITLHRACILSRGNRNNMNVNVNVSIRLRACTSDRLGGDYYI